MSNVPIISFVDTDAPKPNKWKAPKIIIITPNNENLFIIILIIDQKQQ